MPFDVAEYHNRVRMRIQQEITELEWRRELDRYDIAEQAAQNVADELGVDADLLVPTADFIAAILGGAGYFGVEPFPELALPTAGTGPLAMGMKPEDGSTAKAAGE